MLATKTRDAHSSKAASAKNYPSITGQVPVEHGSIMGAFIDAAIDFYEVDSQDRALELVQRARSTSNLALKQAHTMAQTQAAAVRSEDRKKQ